MAPPALMEELVEEVLLRIPPCDPASLVRAALVCKQWCRIVAGAGFRRRFRELHRTPPTLGVLCHLRNGGQYCVLRFVPTSTCPPQADDYDCCAVDARHGRVLICELSFEIRLRVWDPFVGETWELPELHLFNLFGWNAVVLCAARGACDHLDCHGRPFLVVLVASDGGEMRVYVYSSETGSWSSIERTWGAMSQTDFKPVPAALVDNTLYCLARTSKNILKYELTTRDMSVIQPPDFSVECAVLTTVEDGKLGMAGLKDCRLFLWSMDTGPRGDVEWAQIAAIQLPTLLPGNAGISYYFVAFAHDVGLFFLGTNEGLFSIDLKSHKAKKACDGYRIVPYMSFYTPALRIASAGDGPNGGASSA